MHSGQEEAAPPEDPVATFLDIDEDWGDVTVWQTIKLFSSPINWLYAVPQGGMSVEVPADE